MRINSLVILILLPLGILIGSIGYSVLNSVTPKFENLSAEGMYARIVGERDLAINKAIVAGVYKCCINPPCTMCYMEANQWNNNQAGTCACDDLVAQNKDPCPQCLKGRCSEGGTCKSVN